MLRSSSSGRAHPLAVACLVASSIAWSTPLLAQDASATSPTPNPVPAAAAAPESPPAASPSEASPAAATGEAALEEPSADELPPPSAAVTGATDGPGSERSELDLRLRQLEDERSSAVMPWIVFGGGAAIVLVSTALVAAQTLSCDGDGGASDNGCETANWAALALVAGSAVATAGAIWIVRVGSDNAEVDLKQRSIQEDMQRLDARQQRARLSGTESAPRVSMRWQF